MRITAVFIAVLLGVCSVSAQWIVDQEFKTHSQRGIQYVYNLEFSLAEQEFQFLDRTYPSHPAGKFFLAMIDWWKILINIDDESLDDRFIDKLDPVIELCDSLLSVNDNDVTAMFFKGGALGFRGRLRANRSSWLKAANDGRLALPIVQKAYRIAPENKDILLGIGIYNYYAYVIPAKYPLVKPVMVFFPSGNKEKGIEQLSMASQKAEYASIEATYFLLQLFFTYEKRYQEAMSIASSLFQRFPKNVLFHRYVGRCQVTLAQWDNAFATFSEILTRCESKQVGYSIYAKREALYHIGLTLMERRQYGEALKYFYRCDELSRTLDIKEPSSYMSMTNLKIGMIYDLQKKRPYAMQQYQKVLQFKEFEDSHVSASKYLKTPYTE